MVQSRAADGGFGIFDTGVFQRERGNVRSVFLASYGDRLVRYQGEKQVISIKARRI